MWGFWKFPKYTFRRRKICSAHAFCFGLRISVIIKRHIIWLLLAMRILIVLLICLLVFAEAEAQRTSFTRQDTLRGTITPERAWWDLQHYHLDVFVNPADSTITGSNTITYRVLESHPRMQIDLQLPLRIDSVMQNEKRLEATRDGNVWFIDLADQPVPGKTDQIKVYYSGKPRVARMPPWDGGITWKKDKAGNPFVASSCQGIGASVWWPNKDHMYDEPDSMLISVRVPPGLTNVSNGRLRGVETHADSSRTFHWAVQNPINNYGVNINIGDYVHFSDTFPGEKGPLSLDFWVLRQDLKRAKDYFPKEATRTMAAFEHWFGPYPFYNDGYKLVQAPYLGMEHQSSVTYGNNFTFGYMGMDLSRSGWGMKFDFIIVHESGHEWFANNITYRDIADMWIHESFTAYSEALFVEFHYGKDAGAEYVTGTRANVLNDRPIIGQYGVNHEGSGDMYYKGANMLHTLRQVLDDDDLWRDMLRGMNETFRHQTVTTEQIEQYMSNAFGRDLTPLFDQYLRDVRIPVLQYYFVDDELHYQWANTVEGFNMPVRVTVGKQNFLLEPEADWKQMTITRRKGDLKVDPDFYVTQRGISPP